MKFILWTAVWFSLAQLDRVITIRLEPALWTQYADAVAFINVTLWIALYYLIVRKERP